MNEIKKVSEHGLWFIAGEEGCIFHPYKDSVGIWTIGYGNTYYENGKRVTGDDPQITRPVALELFKAILAHYEKAIWSLTRDDINQNEFDALTSLCYNIGVNAFKNSTVLRLVNNNPKDKNIYPAFLMWRRAGGKMILLGRRKREAELYFSPVNNVI